MIKKNLIVVFIFISIFFQPSLGSTTSVSAAILTLEQSIHFITADGSDVVIEPGQYQVEAAEEWLRVIPGERRDALLLIAQFAVHSEHLTASMAHLNSIDENTQTIVLLLPGGRSLEVMGSVSGVRSRAVKRSRVARAPKARQQASRIPSQTKKSAPRKKPKPSKGAPSQQQPVGSTPSTPNLEQRVQLLE